MTHEENGYVRLVRSDSGEIVFGADAPDVTKIVFDINFEMRAENGVLYIVRKSAEDKLLDSTKALQMDIALCIDSLVQARLQDDKEKYEHCQCWMESLMTASLQQFQCLIDKLEERNNP